MLIYIYTFDKLPRVARGNIALSEEAVSHIARRIEVDGELVVRGERERQRSRLLVRVCMGMSVCCVFVRKCVCVCVRLS